MGGLWTKQKAGAREVGRCRGLSRVGQVEEEPREEGRNWG